MSSNFTDVKKLLKKIARYWKNNFSILYFKNYLVVAKHRWKKAD